MSTVLNRVAELGVVPVIAIGSAAYALPLADALLEGGLPVVEITFRTAAAAEVIRILAKERPALLVGAGTVLDPDTVQTAFDAGARFAVAPGLNARVACAAETDRRALAARIDPGVGADGMRWGSWPSIGGAPCTARR